MTDQVHAAEGLSKRDERLQMRPSQSADVLIRGGHVLDPRTGQDGITDVLIRAGEIAEIGAGLAIPEGVEVVDAAGLHVFPAFVDPHVHLRTPGFEYKEDIESGTRAAAAGGFCMVLAMANTRPVVDSVPVLRSLQYKAREDAVIPTGFLATVTTGMDGSDLTAMVELAEAGAVAFSDDGLPIRDAHVMQQALKYQKIAGRVLALHEEDASLSADGVMHEGSISAMLGLSGIPAVSESIAIARDAALALYEGSRCHVQHLSAAVSVEAIEHAKQLGAPVTTEVSPHHLTLTHEAVAEQIDTNFKMNPPLREESDRQALIEGLRSGAIDCIATDHAPHSDDEKELPFELAPMGVTGLETSFASVYTHLVKPGILDLALVVDRLTVGCSLFDLSIPTIKPGAQANICLVDLAAEWVVGEHGYESKSANSCFAGETLSGQVRMTIAAGTVAYRERSFRIQPLAAAK